MGGVGGLMVAVRSAGVDTWSPAWRIDPESWAGAQLASMATRPTKGRSWQLPDAIAGHRVGWFPAAGMLYAEGHPVADGLATAAQLPEAFLALERALLASDVPLPPGVASDDFYGDRHPGFIGLRRLDTTVDIATDTPAIGAAIMAGVASVLGQAGVTETWRRRGALQTVYLRGDGGRRVLGRWYDKGAESGSAAPGRLIRPEDQRRWAKGQRRAPEELTAQYVRGLFHRRYASLWRATEGVTVAGPIVLAQKLADAVEAGEITAHHADRVAGYLLMEAVHVPRAGRTRRRRRSEAAALGLVLSDGLLQEVEVDLHGILDQVMDADQWGDDDHGA